MSLFNSNIKIMKFDEKYIDECVKLLRNNMDEFYKKNYPLLTDEDLKFEIIDHTFDGFVNLVFLKNKFVGFFVYHIYQKKDVLLLNEIHILEKNLGIGSNILNYLFDVCNKNNLSNLDLYVFKGSNAINLYKKNGFEVIKEGKYDNFLMRKKLKLEEVEI